MSLKIINLPEDPFMLLAVLAIGVGLGFALQMFLADRQRKAWREYFKGRGERNRSAGEFGRAVGQNVTADRQGRVGDAADQLRIVMGAEFSAKPLLNRGEIRLYRELDRIVQGRNPGWRVMAQVSLGEILKGKTAEAHSCINSKRVDLLLVDEECQPRHVIEYQGHGHHQGTAAARDAVKKEALRRAGIGFHEVLAGKTTPSDLKRLIEGLITMPASASETTATDEAPAFGKAQAGPWSIVAEQRGAAAG